MSEEYIPTQEDMQDLYNKYPELEPDNKQQFCQHFDKKSGCGCSRLKLKKDKYCLIHTKKKLEKYDIPWMCSYMTKEKMRCRHNILEGEVICGTHKKLNEKRNEYDKTVSRALRSNDRADWGNIKTWSFKNSKSLVQLIEETTNRVRWGSIDLNSARMIIELATKMIDLLIVQKELNKEVTPEENKNPNVDTKGIKEAQKSVMNLRDRIIEITSRKMGGN